MTAAPDREGHFLSIIDGLVLEIDSLSNNIRDLKEVLTQRLNFAADEYEKLVTADGGSSTDSADHIQIVKQIRQPILETPDPPSSSLIKKVRADIHNLKMANHHGNQKMNGARCPVTGAGADPEDMELDFTTSGKQGTLGCPFAKMAANGKLNPADGIDDPVAAEFHLDAASVRSPRTDSRPAGQCPIRFLDQHSPEEIAQYFENHKHEIPRSHEICVRRYQGNENSVRQLDAKYGNLVNMIQGLGVKHKAYLPEKDRIEAQDAPSTSDKAVERWAEKVNSELAVDIEPSMSEEEEARVSRFDKPLREVRVGESPSRPWGISVPPDKPRAPSALQSEAGGKIPATKAEQPEVLQPQHPPAICPVDHSKLNNQDKKPNIPTEEKHEEKIHQPPTQIIFNGPVFFGYSAEQVAMLLQSGNLGKMNPGTT
ncbi:hypothetical protein PV10_08726 [Exophiala mesophila]|uniref:Uncharacterized protein n=1 Tax=Exophiala mesophila TaxID=212818 RepID=A0A0D1Z2Y6_EXOME|nr:uncharacterized protein PV10_08726 [Exophiala mesophila]KIV89127.1 hypothetical protein PV10_08726 [Exophiala mesophila]